MQEFQNSHDSILHNLTSEQKEYATKVLNEFDENRDSAISEIKQWIQESDLRARTDDFFILRFLRTCTFNIEKTKIKIRNYQMQRAKLPKWYPNTDPLQSKLQELLDLGIFLPLRKLDNQGRLIFVSRLVHDPDVITLSEIIKVSSMIGDIALRDSVEASLYGVSLITDLEQLTLRHVTQMTPSFLMNVVHIWQECYPMRIQSLTFINMPEYGKFVSSITRFFLSNRLKEKLQIYSRKTTHDCFKDMPANILPVEYGGTDGTIQELKEYWKKVVEENREWFIEDENYKPIFNSNPQI
ncbi:retinol-binding protein pinta-like [Nylanderia fulva]|uniref:retinol-binding protein pinta-like n=1 Tax=Nylanderia fulva TaxID=613905 RepID=UPI0010FB95C5|nr:retinol-binding protein pinta-like [Nylanderia fulva]